MAHAKDTETASTVDFEGAVSAEELAPAVALLMSELGAGAGGGVVKVYVYIKEQDGGFARVWDGIPEDYDLRRLALEFGSGEYKVTLYSRNGQNLHVKRMSEQFKMRLTAAEEAERVNRHNALRAPHTTDAPAITADGIAAAVARAIAPLLAQPRVDPFESLGKLLPFIQAMHPAPAAAPQREKNAIERLTEMVQVKALTRELRDMDEPDLPESMSELGDSVKILGMIRDIASGGKPQADVAALLGAPVNGDAAPVPIPQLPAQPDEPVELVEMRAQLFMLMLAAKSKRDTEATAEKAYAALYDNETIMTVLRAPDWFRALCTLDADADKYEQWFTAVRNSILAIEREEMEAERAETDVKPALTNGKRTRKSKGKPANP